MQNKEPSIYMRFHVTLEKAIALIKDIYGNAVNPVTGVSRIESSIRIAGLTQQIQCQDYIDYHLTWLVGVLSQALDYNPEKYWQKIEPVLHDLRDEQCKRVQSYISQLTYNRKLPLGQQYKQMVNRINDMDPIPCFIMIFKLYLQGEFIQSHKKLSKSKEDYQAIMSYAYVFWFRAVSKHHTIGKNIKGYIKEFFRLLGDELGGMSVIRNKVNKLYNSG